MTHGIGMAPLASRQGDVNAPARVTPAVRASRARVTRPRSRTHAPARPRAAPTPPARVSRGTYQISPCPITPPM